MNEGQSNQILTCIVDGMRPDRPPAIRGAAARALINSLDFTRSNFETQQERDVIMQVRPGGGGVPCRLGLSWVTMRGCLWPRVVYVVCTPPKARFVEGWMFLEGYSSASAKFVGGCGLFFFFFLDAL